MNQAGDVAICLITNQPADDDCPKGCSECEGEECEEYFVAYSG